GAAVALTGHFRRVVALGGQVVEVFLVHVAGDVLAVEHRAVKAADGAVALPGRLDQVVEILVHQPVGADVGGHLLHRVAVGHQLLGGGHVDAVDIGVAHRRRGGGHVDLGGAGVPGHLDDLPGGGAAHDGVVHQH